MARATRDDLGNDVATQLRLVGVDDAAHAITSRHIPEHTSLWAHVSVRRERDVQY